MKPINALISLLALTAALAAPATLSAQAVVTGTVDTPRTAGEREFTIGGSGASNKDFNDSFGGVNFSYGAYINPLQSWAIRQSINYSNPNNGGAAWNGSTRFAFDHHLTARGRVRPFIGANIGGVYGDAVRDTFAAGLEAGGKFYVQPRTFVYAMAEYGWFFSRARALDDRFSDGQFNYSIGVGFNF